MTAYNWTIEQCDRQTADGLITTAHWRCTAVDGDFTTSVYGSCGFSGELSIPYAEVTEQDVLNWCWENGVDKDAIEASLASQIEALKNPATATGTPWADAP